jgi:hypothetical protein
MHDAGRGKNMERGSNPSCGKIGLKRKEWEEQRRDECGLPRMPTTRRGSLCL